MRPLRLVVSTITVSLVLTALGSATAGASKSAYPVTIDSCGVKTTYTKTPSRVAVNDANQMEDILALGLQNRVVGTWSVASDGPVAPQWRAANAKVHVVSSDNYMTLEQVIKLHPDFLYAGYNYGFVVGTTLTPQYLTKFGIKSYVLSESCAHVQNITEPHLSDIYLDLTNLGKIFNVRARAAKVISTIKAQIGSVKPKVAHLKPVSVFVSPNIEAASPRAAAGLTLATPMLADAGGVNIFSSLKVTYGPVSWEQVVDAKPQCIVYAVYPGTNLTPAGVLHYLKTNPTTETIPAVVNNCLLPVANDELTPDVVPFAVEVQRWPQRVQAAA